MTTTNSTPDPAAATKVGRYYLVFFLAGLPALVYQVAWQRVLTLYFGVDLYSTTITVAAFMLGLGLGSLLGGQVADRARRPAGVYALIELLIGCFGAISVPLFSAVGASFAGGSLPIVLALNFALLLIPSTLMGMTLPLMCRIVDLPAAGIGRHLSWLYGVNTLGAATGAFLSAYLLMGLFGIVGTTWLAAATNVALAFAVVALLAATKPAESAETSGSEPSEAESQSASRLLRGDFLALSFLSGLVGLGYEIVWCRVLACLLHGTVYVFGTVLAIYLLGIGVGSLASRRRIDRPGADARFAWSQAAIAAYTVGLFVLIGHFSWLPGLKHLIGASTYTTFHPSPELLAGEVNAVTLYSLLDIPFWSLLLMGVPTFLMGYGFPNLLRAASQSVETLGRNVATIYFANILGATAGTLVVGFGLLHHFGTERTLLLLAVAGALPIALLLWRHLNATEPNQGRSPAISLAAVAAVVVVSAIVFPGRGDVIRAIHYADFDQVDVVASAEDRTGVVLLKRQRDVIAFPQEKRAVGTYRLHIDGSNHGGLGSLDDVVEDRLARVALAASPRPKRVLSIGLGNGAMCAAAARWPGVEELVVIELNSALSSVLSETAVGRSVLDSPKTRLIADDGRRWLLANPDERFDVVMMFPLHAAHAHSGNLFSLEFFELIRERMAPEGVCFFRSVDCYSTARTVAEAFPHVLRADRTAYLASGSNLRVDLARLGWTEEEFVEQVEADRDAILTGAGDARLNRDMRPNAEFYLTYPRRAWLTPGSKRPVYQTEPRSQLARLAKTPPARLARDNAPTTGR